MASPATLDSQLLAEEGGVASKASMQNPLHTGSAHNSSAMSMPATVPSSAGASDRALLGSSELYDWLHFWSMKGENKPDEAFAYPFGHARARHKHWTPDRGPGGTV